MWGPSLRNQVGPDGSFATFSQQCSSCCIYRRKMKHFKRCLVMSGTIGLDKNGPIRSGTVAVVTDSDASDSYVESEDRKE